MSKFANGNIMSRGKAVVLKASAAETVSTNGAAYDTGNDDGHLYVEVNVTAAAGTTPTLLVAVQGSMDGTNWFTLGTVGASGFAGPGGTAPTAFTVAAGPVRAYFPMPQFVRYASTITGSAGQSFTYTVKSVVGN